jgi:hypothetical protein
MTQNVVSFSITTLSISVKMRYNLHKFKYRVIVLSVVFFIVFRLNVVRMSVIMS